MQILKGTNGMDILRLEMIAKLYEGKSLAEVAAEYNYTPSAVSHMLKAVENELGIQLFIRDRTSVTPTLEGREIYGELQTLIDNNQKMQKKAKKLSNKQIGVIRLSAFTSVVVSWLPQIINTFKEQYSDIRFEILQGNYQETEEWIRQGYVDCGFTLDINSADIESYHLTDDKLFLIFPKDHPFERKKDFLLSDLENYPYICLCEGSEQFILDYIVEHNVDLNIVCRVVDDYAVSAMVESGIGISIVPELFLYRSPYAIGSRVLDENFHRPICISCRRDYKLSPITEAFIEHVRKWARDNPNVLEEERSQRLIIPGDETMKF